MEKGDSAGFKYDEAIRARIEAVMAERDWTIGIAARLIKLSSPTRLGKYLALNRPEAVPEADAPRVEAAIRNWLRHQDRCDVAAKNLFANKVSAAVSNAIKLIREIGDMGVLYGPAGIGKTCGAQIFRAQNPEAIFITLTVGARGASSVERMIYEEIVLTARESWPGNTNRFNWICDLLRGSEYVILIDGAQRLHISAAELLSDLHDRTGCAVVYIGNPSVLDVLRTSDQLTSRIGLCREIQAEDDDDDVAARMIGQYAPDSSGELKEPAAAVLAQSGHSRALRKQLILAAVLHRRSKIKDWPLAFAAAGKQLVKPSRPARRSR